MGKSINIHEACVITKDDKGNLSLVGKAKEALTSLDKHKVAIHIKLCDSKKDDVEKFLQENNVPFTSITAKGESPEGKDEKGEKKNDSTVTVVPRSKFVTLDGDWSWCLDSIVQRLWGEKKKENPKSEQQRMDDSMADYIRWASPKKKEPENASGTSLG